MSQRKAGGATASTILLLILVLILFGIVVGYGWLRLLATEMDPIAAGILAALITFIAILLAQLVGRAILVRRETGVGAGRIGFLYAILFTISALGTINAAFYNFEGSSVLQQVIDDAERKLAALDSASETALRDSSVAEREAAVQRELIQLEGEILNPRNCGSGRRAREIIGRITALLPSFREFSQREDQRRCDPAALTELSRQYRDTAMRMLDLDPGQRQRAALRAGIEGPIAQARSELHTAETDLAAHSGFGRGYGPAQLALEHAATIYAESREKLANAAPNAAEPLRPQIDLSRSRYLGSITAMPGTLAQRLDYWTTWFYFIVAVLLDFFLVFLFVENLRTASPRPLPPPPQRDPKFLWVNQTI